MKYAETKPVSTMALCWMKRRRKRILVAAAPEREALMAIVRVLVVRYLFVKLLEVGIGLAWRQNSEGGLPRVEFPEASSSQFPRDDV
jgi:hypothetical protein